MIRPLQLAFYKGITSKWGALQLNEQFPHYYIKENGKFKNYDSREFKSEWLNSPDWDPSWTAEKNLVSREGCLFLEISSATGPNEYDWANKIIMALSIVDMGKILLVLDGLSESVKILHDPGAKSASQGKVTKTIEISSPKGIKEGVFVRAREQNAGSDVVKQHQVPLSADEARVLNCCLRHAIPRALAW